MVLCLQLLRLILKTAIITDKINEEGYVVNLKDILYITICIITVWLGLFLSILAHEAGHMIGYLLSAGKKKAIGILQWEGVSKFLKQRDLLFLLSPSVAILNVRTIFQKKHPC